MDDSRSFIIIEHKYHTFIHKRRNELFWHLSFHDCQRSYNS